MARRAYCNKRKAVCLVRALVRDLQADCVRLCFLVRAGAEVTAQGNRDFLNRQKPRADPRLSSNSGQEVKQRSRAAEAGMGRMLGCSLCKYKCLLRCL